MLNEEEIKVIKKDVQTHPIKWLISISLYFASLLLGIIAAYESDLIVALFWAIVFASENIAVSIEGIWKFRK